MNSKTSKIIIQSINRYKLFVAIFAITTNLFSQQTYFQQEVNYKIDVSLNDVNHSLKAFEEIQYINKASNAITYIYFHLWPNAYKNNQTALAKQLLNQKRTDLYYSTPEERGYIDSLNFKVNGKIATVEYDAENPDICKVLLNEPLKSLDTITISTPFFVKIPSAKFSRMGHDEQAYYITQWYPKPAVYDKSGWHQMPYLDQGEFFSEFGSFEVTITLPENYVIAATGDRVETDEEVDFLNSKVAKTLAAIERNQWSTDMSFPPSSNKTKTVQFKQYRVHDFAWFADKRFNVLHDQIQLPNTNRTVDTWVYFTNKQFGYWKDAIDYVNESTMFYSYLVGDYPYNHVSAVDGLIMAGGGMEYPNITVIGSVNTALELDVTIAHEVGHNWFYGILGSNERDFPALDEGVNSFYEMSYIRAKYSEKKIGQLLGVDSTFKFFGLNKIPYWRHKEMAYFLSAKANSDQPIETGSEYLSEFNYGSIIYSKTAVALDYLRDYMGDETFNKAMQFYYENFKFKHPTPVDLYETLNYFSGNDLVWFSKYLMQTTNPIDYKIKSVKRTKDGSYDIKVKNKGGIAAPINVYGYKNGKVVGLTWFSGFNSSRTLNFPPSDIDQFKIDGLDLMPDINRRNNFSRTHGILKKIKSPQFNFITKLPNPTKNQINYLPIAGVNYYNGFMLGAAVHNYSIYDKKVEFSLAPMYAFKTKTITGFGDINLNFFPKRTFTKITLGAYAKSFSNELFSFINFASSENDYYLNYIKLKPYLLIDFNNKNKTSHIKQSMSFAHHLIYKEQLNYSYSNVAQTTFYFKQQLNAAITVVNYYLSNKRAIHPYHLNGNFQTDGIMAKVSMSFKQIINISKSNQMEMRFFVGTFTHGNDVQKGPYRFRLSGITGANDYLFEGNYFGRSEYSGFAFSQFMDSDGAFKTWTPLGQSGTYLITANIKSPKLWKFPLRAFADIGTAGANSLTNETVLWDAGLNLVLADGLLEVFLPLVYSNDIKETLTLNNVSFWNTVRFTFNIHQLKPRNFIKNNFL